MLRQRARNFRRNAKMLLKVRCACSIYPLRFGIVMQLSIFRAAALFFLVPACAFSASNVVNLSHYDMMRPDFAAMKREGIIGVIHEATYPHLVRDAKYFERQQAATRAGLLWGAYHYANGTDPIRQADHFLSVVSNAWTHADPAARSNGVLLVLDFEKNGHYPGGTMRVDQAVAFVERIRERTGKYPGIYSGEYYMHQNMNSLRLGTAQASVLGNCWLWLANYSHQPRATSPWNARHMWQYCGDGRCKLPTSAYPKSIAKLTTAERNIFNGTSTALQIFWRDHAWQPSENARRET